MDGRILPHRPRRRGPDGADAGPGAECQRVRGSVRTLHPLECLDRLIFFGERRLLRAIYEFVAHSTGHQGLGNEWISREIH